MNSLLDRLTEADREEFREWSAIAEDVEWPAQVARDHGWLSANASYHTLQEQLGYREMHGLMDLLAIEPPVDRALAEELVTAATELCMQSDRMRVVSRAKNGEMHLYSTNCPLYELFMNPRWQGLTACGCFSRRKGWYAALAGVLGEELVKSRKWGDAVCEVIVAPPGELDPTVPLSLSGASPGR
jgi:hypothetical protein